MAKTKQQKQQALQDYGDNIARAQSLVFVNFAGLKVKEIEELRKKCRDTGIGYVVAKKTLMDRAFQTAGLEGVVARTLPDSVATVFGYEDEIAPAKVIGEFAKTHEALKPIGGVLERRFIDVQKVLELAKLPSRPELIAKLLGSLQAPVSGIVSVMSGTLRSLVGVLSAIQESKS